MRRGRVEAADQIAVPDQRRGQIDEVRVLAVATRNRDDSESPYREKLRVDQWEVPILEFRLRLPTIS